jgi:transposase
MAVADANGLPIAIHTRSASPGEVTLVHETLEQRLLAATPRRLIADRAYDSNKLTDSLASEGIQLIAPHRPKRVNIRQDGRCLRRYRRRWKVERLFAWLKNFRRIVNRWERDVQHFLGFVFLACSVLLLKRYL